MMNILAIDPGNIESAYVVVDENMKPIKFDKIPNNQLYGKMEYGAFDDCEKIAIEMIASYGMAVGKEVFDTCVWIGRFIQILIYEYDKVPQYVYRQDEKMYLCHSMRAKDSNIQRALIDKFAQHDLKRGKGTKKNPDWFYGFHNDIWAAYAVAYAYREMLKEIEVAQ